MTAPLPTANSSVIIPGAVGAQAGNSSIHFATSMHHHTMMTTTHVHLSAVAPPEN